ncbi:hypothetical protein RhiJN_27076 [Ceratobasidium sp. AG-Ba]|nr:hypothetical protein RhiJN_27076 [Ceratobasidium sp. AG-Ba]
MSPPSIFTSRERQFFLTYLQRWVELKGSCKERDEFGKYFSLKDRLVDEVIDSFFKRFPERDKDQQPNGAHIFSQEVRDTLHLRIRRFFYNNTWKTEEAFMVKAYKYMSFYLLFKQRYNKEILQERGPLPEGASAQQAMSAYNAAVDRVLARVSASNPDDVDELKKLSKKMRQTAALPFKDQDADVQTATVATLKDWEKRTGARIYLMACWWSPKEGPSAFDWVTRNAKQFMKTGARTAAMDIWKSWVWLEFGAELECKVDESSPAVWFNNDGWPMLPDVRKYPVNMERQKKILRRWFICIYAAYGGAPPSYKRLEVMTRDQPGVAIDVARLPAGFPILDDLRDWRRDKLDAWTIKILHGQDGRLSDMQIFHPREVFKKGSKVPTIIQEARRTPVPDAVIIPLPDELLFTERMRRLSTVPDSDDAHGLPTILKEPVYTPYGLGLYEVLCDEFEEGSELWNLIHEIAYMEEEAPVHNIHDMGALCGSYNPHLLENRSEQLAELVLSKTLLGSACFNFTDREHAAWSIDSFSDWVRAKSPHIDKVTGTVYGGPLGVRQIVLALARIELTLRSIRNKRSRPTELQTPAVALTLNDDLKTWDKEYQQLVNVVRNDISKTRQRLQATLPRRVAIGAPNAHEDGASNTNTYLEIEQEVREAADPTLHPHTSLVRRKSVRAAPRSEKAEEAIRALPKGRYQWK